MNTRVLIIICFVLASIRVYSAVGDTIVSDSIRYIITQDSVATGNTEVGINLIYEQDYVTVPASIVHNGVHYKITSIAPQIFVFDSIYHSIFEKGDSLSPKQYKKVDFTASIHLKSELYRLSPLIFYTHWAVIDTLIMPPNMDVLPRIVDEREFGSIGYIHPYDPSESAYRSGIRRVFSCGTGRIPNAMWGTMFTSAFLIEADFSSYNTTDTIDRNFFSRFYRVEKVTIPNSVRHIEYNAFSNCYNLSSINIPDSLLSVGGHALENANLHSVHLPETVEQIGNLAFASNANLSSFEVDANNKRYSTDDGILFSKSRKSIYSILTSREGGTYTIPHTVDTIAGSLYYGNHTHLDTLYFSHNLRHLAPLAFYNSPISIFHGFEHTKITIIPDMCFHASKIKELILPIEIQEITHMAFRDCDSLRSVRFTGSTLKELTHCSFLDCKNLQTLDMSSLVRINKIQYDLCRYNVSLRSVKLPVSIDTIERKAFEGCSSLDTIYAPIYDPPYVEPSAFDSVDRANCLVIVPHQLLSKYQAAPVWREFFYRIDTTSNQYLVDAYASDSIMGYVTGVGVYDINSEVVLEAIPHSGYKFKQWSDGCTNNVRTLTVTQDTLLIAHFEATDVQIKYVVDAHADDSTTGYVTGGGEYAINSKVVLEAIPHDGYKFIQWSDGLFYNTPIRELTVTQDTLFIAIFDTIDTHISNNGDSKSIIYTHEGAICIDDTSSSTVEIYTLQGVLLYRGKSKYIEVPAPAIYIVKYQGKRIKLTVS